MANNEKTDESVKRKSHETREAVLNDEHIDRAPRFQNVQEVLDTQVLTRRARLSTASGFVEDT